MTGDLLEDYDLIGMTEAEIVDLLGADNQDDRYVYYLGNERTMIDGEWLLIEFENGVVTGYSMTTD